MRARANEGLAWQDSSIHDLTNKLKTSMHLQGSMKITMHNCNWGARDVPRITCDYESREAHVFFSYM